MSGNSMIIYCKCTHRKFVSEETSGSLLNSIEKCGADTVIVDDLCGLAAGHDPVLKDWAGRPQIFIIACYERAVRWLFDMAGAALSCDSSVRILNPRTMSPEKIVKALSGSITESEAKKSEIIEHKDSPEPWFPVIDRSRCRSCRLCFNFCLFGVYTADANGNILVSSPENCKNNCPACARVCPARAIIFPKLDQSPINGDEINESDGAAAPVRLDLLQETDIYAMLRSRGKQDRRFSPVPREHGSMLEILHKQLDIPVDVLESLSPSDLNRIRKKASAAGDSDET